MPETLPAGPDPAGLVDPRRILWQATAHRRDGHTLYAPTGIDPTAQSPWYLSTRAEVARAFDEPLTPLTANQLIDQLITWATAPSGPAQRVHPQQLRLAIAARDTETLLAAAAIADAAAAHCRSNHTWPDIATTMCLTIRDRIRDLAAASSTRPTTAPDRPRAAGDRPAA